MNRAARNRSMATIAATTGRPASGEDRQVMAEIEHDVEQQADAEREAEDEATEVAGLTAEERAEVAEVVTNARSGRGHGRSALDANEQDEVAQVVARARRVGGKWVVHRG